MYHYAAFTYAERRLKLPPSDKRPSNNEQLIKLSYAKLDGKETRKFKFLEPYYI